MLKIVTGGQTGVDRAALDAAIELGIPYGGWCPKGGWAEDLPEPPGLLALYPNLRETPDADPRAAHRMERARQRPPAHPRRCGRARGVEGNGVRAQCAKALAKPWHRHRSRRRRCAGRSARALFGDGEGSLVLGIGGPRESEAPGIYAKARAFLRALLEAELARQRQAEIARRAPADQARRQFAAQEIIQAGEEADLIAEPRPGCLETSAMTSATSFGSRDLFAWWPSAPRSSAATRADRRCPPAAPTACCSRSRSGKDRAR